MVASAVIRFAAWLLLAAPQAVESDEIRVTSRAYLARPLTLQVETNLVEVGVVVRDSGGHAVSGLTKANFRIRDDGKESEIASFAADSTAAQVSLGKPDAKADEAPMPGGVRPRFIALYFDDVNSQDEQHANDLKQTREAAGKFVKDDLQPGVKIGVFTASGTPALDFTDDFQKVSVAIAAVRANGRLSERGASACAAVSPYLAYLIAVRRDPAAMSEVAYQCRGSEEVIRAQAEETWQRARELSVETLASIGQAADHLAAMRGTRILLLASTGFLTATLERQRDELVSRALHEDIVMNALDSKGLDGWRPVEASVPLTGPGSKVAAGLAHQRFEQVQVGLRVDAMNEPLAALAEGTGGVFFHDNNNLEAGFRELAALPEITYRLSFRLPEGAAENSYHKLAVKVIDAKYKSVQSRPGYYVPARKAAESLSRLDQEVSAGDALNDFPVQLSASNAKLAGGEIAVSVIANVDISKLRFGKQDERKTQKIRFVSALKDAQGTIVAAKEATMDLALKEQTYDRFAKSGLNAKLTLQVPPGAYQLREVVEETGGKMACSTNPIEVK